MNTNQHKLLSYLKELKHSSVFSDIVIETLGIRLHLLKDKNEKIYCLVVPEKPVNKISVDKFKELGFQEKFEKINFIRFFNLEDIDDILEITEKVLINILNVPAERQWRFNICSGMALVKMNEPEIPNSLRRKMIKERNNKPLNKFGRKYGIYFIISLLLSAFLGINYKDLFESVQDLIGLIILLTIGLTLIMKFIETIDRWIKKMKYNR